MLFVLLLSCAVCLYAQNNLNTQFFTANGTLPTNGGILSLPTPVDVTNRPGPLLVTLHAQFPIEFCISPIAAVSSNLASSCPTQNYFYFNFTNNLTSSLPIALFLDDFSMNFRGKYLESYDPVSVNSYPANITAPFKLLQNIDYYISLSFDTSDAPPNSTYAQYALELNYYDNTVCAFNQVPTFDILNGARCVNITVGGMLNQPPYNLININDLSKANPALLSFEIAPLTPYVFVNLTAIGDDTIEDLTLLISYNQFPTAQSAQYRFSTFSTASSVVGPTAAIFRLDNPLPGTYYAQLSSQLIAERGVQVVYNPNTNCTISTADNSDCGNFTYNVVGENDVDQFKFNNTDLQYYVVNDVSAFLFGVQETNFNANVTNVTFTALVGINYFPSFKTLESGIGAEYRPINGTFFNSLNSTSDATFIIALKGTPSLNVIIWQGATCPQNCNGKGTCSSQYKCECNDDYSGDYCEDHSSGGLSTLYIILIIIGGAIVLAVLIGVPVALYLNNRKRARYERV